VIRLLAQVGGCAVLAALALLIVAPRMNWGAEATPGAVEKSVAGLVLRQWVRHNAPADNNPFPPTADNLTAGRREFGEHCSVCHGADGSARTPLGADFYPPIARLERGAPGWSDGELFFMISNGIRYTGMPGFGTRHKPETIWRIILWIRQLPHLTAQEKADLQNQGSEGLMKHEAEGEHGD
jgi:mono/diheme cytochrome c family protein